MTIVLDVSLSDHQPPSNSDSQNSAITEIKCKRAKDKHNACSSKPIKVAKVKNKVSVDAELSFIKVQLRVALTAEEKIIIISGDFTVLLMFLMQS